MGKQMTPKPTGGARAAFAYIFPAYSHHSGINIKVAGQLSTLRQHYDTRWVHLQAAPDAHPLIKAVDYLWFHLRAGLEMCRCGQAYIRYNPKVPFLLLYSSLVSVFKPIYIEHNVKMDQELAFLGRTMELRLHRLCLFGLKWGRQTHVCVTKELQEHLVHVGVPGHRVRYCQNGYMAPVMHKSPASTVIEAVQEWRSAYEKIAIFTGNGYPWHGIDLVQQILKPYPNVGLIVVGPYDRPSPHEPQWHYTGKLDTPTLFALYEMADFAIGTFRWDMLAISQGSPLKSREYLAHGLPILINYDDCAEDFDALKPRLYHYHRQKEAAITGILKDRSDATETQKVALRLLSWENLWRQSGIIL